MTPVTGVTSIHTYTRTCVHTLTLCYTCRTFYWVRNEAPVIIHVNLSAVLEHLVRDTHYRNLFEVGGGGGTAHFPTRARWEVRRVGRVGRGGGEEGRGGGGGSKNNIS